MLEAEETPPIELCESDIDDGWTLSQPEEPLLALVAYCRCGFASEGLTCSPCPRCGAALVLSVVRPDAPPPRSRHPLPYLPGVHAPPRPPRRLLHRADRDRGQAPAQPAPAPARRGPSRRAIAVAVPALILFGAAVSTLTWFAIG